MLFAKWTGSGYRQDKTQLRLDTVSGTALSLMCIDGFFELRALARHLAARIDTPALLSLKNRKPPKAIQLRRY